MPDAAASRRVAESRRVVVDWFGSQGWQPFRFQRQLWNAFLNGESGLLHSTTGTGKTYAAWLGPLMQWMAEQSTAGSHRGEAGGKSSKRNASIPLRVLWVTPLRALAFDTEQSLLRPVTDLNLPWTVETRTGETAGKIRARQKKRLPTALVTTPESLSLMLTWPDARERFADLRLVVVDEWHELLSTKRGVQTELALARLRRWQPDLRTWGLSATLGNIEHAMDVLLGSSASGRNGRLIQGNRSKRYDVASVVPEQIERFPWAGHLGARLVPQVAELVDSGGTSLLFTNTRFQAEHWYQALLAHRPEWAGLLAVHHGSIDQQTRRWVEAGLRDGTLKAVVCTSSLDLGVDFTPVDRVVQIGSPRGVARLLQRAGRSGHQPGRTSRVHCVPTHAIELVEIAAVRDAVEVRAIEGRTALECPIDVLVQHAVTIALGDPYRADDLFEEVRTTWAYRNLTDKQWQWVLKFVTEGGEALRAYPDYHRVTYEDDLYRITDQRIARRHRMSIGTIASDAMIAVQFLKGPRLGSVEESFIARLKPGDVFTFAGRTLELASVRDHKAWVRLSKGKPGVIPRWQGGRMPLSSELARAVRDRLGQARDGFFTGAEMQAARPLLELQKEWSALPEADELLIEQVKTREGHHLFFYPFAGRLVHEGLSALFAYRLSRLTPITFTMSVNDYGFELLSPQPAPLAEALDANLFATDGLTDDIFESLNAAEMAKRRFREIARVAGLVFEGYPGDRKSARHLQASTGLLYDVFANYDPDNLLLEQARQEVLELQLEQGRLRETLLRLGESRVLLTTPRRPTPLSFPLLVARFRERLTSEKLADRIQRMQLSLEKAASDQP